MKILLVILLILINIYANENWIPLKSSDSKEKIQKNPETLNIDLSQVAPVKSMINKVTLIKNLIDMTNKSEVKKDDTDKNWYILK